MSRQRFAIILAAGLMGGTMTATAQTATPTATPTGGASGTPCDLLLNCNGTATLTPYPTWAWPTLTPAPAIALRAWPTWTPPPLGTAFIPPPLPPLNLPDVGNTQMEGFDSLGDLNLAQLMVYFFNVVAGFFGWIQFNLAGIVSGFRWFMVVLTTLYGIFFIWKGSKYAPRDVRNGTSRETNSLFFRSFRLGGKYHYYNRNFRQREQQEDEAAERRMLKPAFDAARRSNRQQVLSGRRAYTRFSRQTRMEQRIDRQVMDNVRKRKP